MEPCYVGRNGHLDAFAAAWLLGNDHVFFLEDQIVWDGKRHAITGAQVNSNTEAKIPEFSDNSEVYLRGVIDVMTALEDDGDLHVEKEKIHPALYPALRDEDLTGITLFNLQACRGAITISTLSGEAGDQEQLERAGLEWVLGDPQARSNTYIVSVDSVLLKGIPKLPELIKKMVLDMRAYNGVEDPCAVLVLKRVESEPNQCFRAVNDIVKGSVSKNLIVDYWPTESQFMESASDSSADKTDNGVPDTPESQDLSKLEVGEASHVRAAIAVRQASEKGVTLDYSEESIEALEGLLHRLYTSREIRMASDEKVWDVAYIYGSYLGETMLRAGFSDQGFAWAEDYDGEPCLQRDTTGAPEGVATVGKMVPITKVYKRLSNGPDESVWEFYKTTKSFVSGPGNGDDSNEPEYIDENGNIDPMAVAWLFAHDYIFFNDDEIIWDGVNHKVTGAQMNMAKILEMPKFIEGAGTYMPQIGELLAQLESDRRLVVPRERIHQGLYGAIREGDLTGITLFNLQACARAFMFLDDENEHIKRQTLEMAGLDSLLDDPDSDKNIFMVSADLRLLRGIPDFYGLVKRMFEDMRAFSGNEDPFVLAFVSSRNVDADQCLGEVGYMVDGAVSEPFHIEMGGGPSSGGIQADETSEGSVENEAEEVSDREATIALLRMLVLSNDLGGTNSKYPQDMLDELERAENGDETVDVDGLQARMIAFGPESSMADVSSVTFDEGKRVTGRRFSMAVPDGWTALENYAESTFMGEQVRPFVIVSGEATVDDDVSRSDRVIYSSLAGDTEPAEEMLDFGIADLKWALSFNAAYDRSDDQFGALKPIPLWDEEVQAVNTKCFVMEGASIPGGEILDGPNALQYTITPYALDHMDFLRVSMSYEEGKTDIEELRAFIVKLASTVELDNPIVPTCEKTLEKALTSRVSADEFAEMAESFVKPYFALRQMVFTSFQYRHVARDGGTEDDELTLAGARGIAEFDGRAVPVFERLLDAYDRQVDEGASIADLDKMLESLTQFDALAFPTSEIFDGDNAKLVDENGVFKPSQELVKARERLEFAKEHGGMRTVSAGAKAVASNTVAFVPKSQEHKPPQRTIEEPYKTKGLERLEKALKEKIDARYFIETSEMIAEELMGKRQEACDRATSATASDEDNVTAMAREFGRFNDVFCRYFGHMVTVIEAQSDLGTTRSELERMTAEANEFAELVADRFSCGNDYLDDIANKRAPVKRPGEYDEIRSRWQKLNER